MVIFLKILLLLHGGNCGNRGGVDGYVVFVSFDGTLSMLTSIEFTHELCVSFSGVISRDSL